MKKALIATMSILALIALVLIGGCGGGSTKQVVKSPWYGDLYGVATEPADGETGIPTSRVDSWIHVFWPDSNYPPPASFTMKVEKEETLDHWGLINTTLSNADSDPEGGSWWFQPNSDFSPATLYRITITVPGGYPAVAYFQTVGTRGGAVSALATRSVKTYRPAGTADAVGETSAEHTIKK